MLGVTGVKKVEVDEVEEELLVVEMMMRVVGEVILGVAGVALLVGAGALGVTSPVTPYLAAHWARFISSGQHHVFRAVS